MSRIAIIGPESVGKSTLARQLGKMLKLPVVDEYARTYVEQLNRPYTYEDVEIIARRQTEEYQKYDNAIFDTDIIITKVWFDVVFDKCPEWLIAWLQTHKMDFYLLLKPTLPWEPDPVRENPDNRWQLYNIYKTELQNLNAQFIEIGL